MHASKRLIFLMDLFVEIDHGCLMIWQALSNSVVFAAAIAHPYISVHQGICPCNLLHVLLHGLLA